MSVIHAVAGVLLQPDNGFASATTDSQGRYALGAPTGYSFSVVPSKTNLVFVPSMRPYLSDSTSVSNQNYLAASTIAASLQAESQLSNIVLRWNGLPGVTYQLYSSTNLVDWLPYQAPYLGSNAEIRLTVPIGNDPEVFIRAASGSD